MSTITSSPPRTFRVHRTWSSKSYPPSTAERDKTFKRALYARHGVNEYWMVDTTAKDITILLLGERGYEVVGTYGEEETLTSPTMQGFTLNIGDLF